MSGLVPWILALMALASPPLKCAGRIDIARAFDIAAHERPLYDGADKYERTIAELVAVSARESRFDPKAVGTDEYGKSFSLGQVHESNFARLGLTEQTVQDPLTCARAMLVLLDESHKACRNKPLEDQLAAYASGRGQCDVPEGVAASRNRMRLMAWLLMARPAVYVEAHQ